MGFKTAKERREYHKSEEYLSTLPVWDQFLRKNGFVDGLPVGKWQQIKFRNESKAFHLRFLAAVSRHFGDGWEVRKYISILEVEARLVRLQELGAPSIIIEDVQVKLEKLQAGRGRICALESLVNFSRKQITE